MQIVFWWEFAWNVKSYFLANKYINLSSAEFVHNMLRKSEYVLQKIKKREGIKIYIYPNTYVALTNSHSILVHIRQQKLVKTLVLLNKLWCHTHF